MVLALIGFLLTIEPLMDLRLSGWGISA